MSRLAGRRGASLVLALLLAPAGAPAQPGPEALLQRLESAWAARSVEAYLALWSFASPEAREEEERFARTAFAAGDARLILDRPAAPPPGPRLVLTARTLEISEPRARVAQWRLRLASGEGGWRLLAREPLGQVDGLVHLSLDPKGFRADGLTLSLPDFELHFERGTLFTSPASLGPTVLVFVGSARLRISPRPATEREQLRQFAGQPELVEDVEQAFVRLHPADWHYVLKNADLTPDPGAAGRFDTAARLFQSQSQQSYLLDAGLPGSPWWVLPSLGDALVAFRSRRGLLTFTVSNAQAEAISLFDREKKRQICLYPAEGRDTRYNEDDLRDVDVLSHRLKARFEPDQQTIVAEDTLRIRLRSMQPTLRLRLDDALRVSSVSSAEGGEHLFLRVRNQDSLMVSLGPLAGLPEITLNVRYAGPLPEGRIEDEALQVPGNEPIYGRDDVQLETVSVYSNRTLWYPQVEPDDYAQAEMELDVPAGQAAVAGGLRRPRPGDPRRSLAVYSLEQPAKYLAVALGRLQPAAEGNAGGVRVQVWATPRRRGDAAEVLERSRDILGYYGQIFGPCPYPTLNVVLMEGEVPGGHSPPGLVVLTERPLLLRGSLREDPATLWGIPGFFLAHELAHQWWGQGTAPQNYRERWLSEGTAQYAAALWARHARGEATFQEVLRHLARWATRKTGEGPINLGHRLGHLKQDPQIYRALVYSKAAYVLHMLAGLLGEERLLLALRGFQERYRFAKAGTDDLRAALEAQSGLDLKPYFEAWIYGTELPVLSVERTIADKGRGRFTTTVRVKAEHVPGPLPLQIALFHAAGATRKQVTLAPEGGVYELDSPARPTRVEVNADRRLLAVVGGPSR